MGMLASSQRRQTYTVRERPSRIAVPRTMSVQAEEGATMRAVRVRAHASGRAAREEEVATGAHMHLESALAAPLLHRSKTSLPNLASLGGRLRGLLDLVNYLLRDLVLLVHLHGLCDRLGGELAGVSAEASEGLLEANILVNSLDRLHNIPQGLLGVITQRILNRAADLAGDGVLLVDICTEVQNLQATCCNALQRLGEVVVLSPREVGGGRKGGGADPHAAEEQPQDSTQHTGSGHLVLLCHLHNGD
mmetsp:Transcript_104529/g.327045  ORF Transcript_104529/g.327045 Transcript_104529/m.327045 type:complete len:248 (-) Transcript_104529:286-1029(-)